MLSSSIQEDERRQVKGTIKKRRYDKDSKSYCLQVEDVSGIVYNFTIYEKSSLFHVVQNFKETDSVMIDMTLTSKENMVATMHYISGCDLVDKEYVDTNGLISRFKSFLRDEMHDKVLKKMLINGLTETWVNESWFNKNFFSIPASSNEGYAFKGGLLARTVRLIEKVSREIDYLNGIWEYNLTESPTLNKDICITAVMLDGIIQSYIFDLKNGKNGDLYGTLINRESVTIKMINEANLGILEKYRLSEKELLMLQHIILAIDPVEGYVPNQREAQLVYDIYETDKNYSLYEQFDRTNRTGLVKHGSRRFYTETYKSKIRNKTVSKIDSENPFGDLAKSDTQDEDKMPLKSAVNEFN